MHGFVHTSGTLEWYVGSCARGGWLQGTEQHEVLARAARGSGGGVSVTRLAAVPVEVGVGRI